MISVRSSLLSIFVGPAAIALRRDFLALILDSKIGISAIRLRGKMRMRRKKIEKVEMMKWRE